MSPRVLDRPAIPSYRPASLLRAALLLGVVGLLLLLVGSPRTLAPYDPFALSARDRLQGPSWEHPLGTDRIGRDVLSRVIIGARPSLLVSVGIVALSLVGGLIFGVLAGFVPRLDDLIMRVMDGLMAFPFILLAMAILAFLGRNIPNIIDRGPGRTSAFMSSDIDERLRELGVAHLYFGGVSTNICVDGTARDAADRGYDCALIEDACAGVNEELHRGSLLNFECMSGRVLSTEDVIRELSDGYRHGS